MKIFKFGGASVKNADAITNLKRILNSYEEGVIVVISAIDKTTNALEKLYNEYIHNNTIVCKEHFEKIYLFHFGICEKLFNNKEMPDITKQYFEGLQKCLNKAPSLNHDFEYDQIVSFGELFSTSIISAYLNENNTINQFLDIRIVLRTDTTYREANIDWNTSEILVQKHLQNNTSIVITQGFIASTHERISTTLGREGSDFTAAALGYMLNAKEVIIWKDVPGIMNADPKWNDSAEKIDLLSYQEAIELSFYGAKVIHQKTIKPLQNKNIPLSVQSFLNPNSKGTVIRKVNHKLYFVPIYIIKEDQILLSISPRDFSFIVEENISKIFALFAQHRIKVNIIQNSAISLSASIDSTNKLNSLIENLKKDFTVRYNTGLTLITIRHYTTKSIEKMSVGRNILMEQRSRSTIRMVTDKIK